MLPRAKLLIALLWLPLVTGCEGCRRDDQRSVEEKESPTEEFSSLPALAFPTDGTPSVGIKPGHWITASQSLKSNLLDARGQLVSQSSTSNTSSTTGTRAQDFEPQVARGRVASMRPAVLPKGQMRRFNYRILTAVPSGNDQNLSYLSSRFVANGVTVYEDEDLQQPVVLLPPEEFFFVILSERPERFARLQVSDWVRPVRDESSFKEFGGNYRIVIPPTDEMVPVAETMLDWTSTAYLCYDDISPELLTPQQQTAIADWVRFGGQLIVNGADAADSMSKTALAELLPLMPTGNIELDADAAAKLLQHWAVGSDRSTEKQIALLRGQSGRVAVAGEPAADAIAIQGSQGLLLARSFGRGRVIQSRFDLTGDWLVNWQSYDSFVNAALLSRPRREVQDAFNAADEGLNAADDSLLRQRYPDYDVSRAEPAFNTRFRIAARDAVIGANKSDDSMSVANRYDPWTANQSFAGISGWSDDSDVISICREILRSESGIEIPSSSLVVRSLGYYLLILIPVNYLVFRLLGRLEYAWLAVPVIALAGAIWVARAARLDIGFARSQTELGFLETQPGYARGHLSRVVAIYNSLSSSYDIAFKTSDAAAAPIRVAGESREAADVYFKTGFAEGPILSGLPVISNQIRMIHAEQVVDLGGSIELSENGQLVNRTKMALDDAFVVEKDDRGQVRIAVVGPLGAGVTTSLRFLPFEQVNAPRDLPMQTSRMLEDWMLPGSIPNGSVRMLARYDGSLDGIEISPATQQTAAQTIVLAHLKHPAWPEPKADVNLIADLRPVLSGKSDGDTDASEPEKAENP